MEMPIARKWSVYGGLVKGGSRNPAWRGFERERQEAGIRTKCPCGASLAYFQQNELSRITFYLLHPRARDLVEWETLKPSAAIRKCRW